MTTDHPQPLVSVGGGFMVSPMVLVTCAHVTGAGFASDAPRTLLVAGSTGSGKSQLLVRLLKPLDLSLRWLNEGQSLRIGDSRFLDALYPFGRRHIGGAIARLLRMSAESPGSVLHPLTPIEQHAGVEEVAGPRPSPPQAEPASGRLIQRAAARLNRKIERSKGQFTFVWLLRRLIRAAISILRQLLRMQRRLHAETPEAVSHSHNIDQHRTRGPNRARTTSPSMVLREPARI